MKKNVNMFGFMSILLLTLTMVSGVAFAADEYLGTAKTTISGILAGFIPGLDTTEGMLVFIAMFLIMYGALDMVHLFRKEFLNIGLGFVFAMMGMKAASMTGVLFLLMGLGALSIGVLVTALIIIAVWYRFHQVKNYRNVEKMKSDTFKSQMKDEQKMLANAGRSIQDLNRTLKDLMREREGLIFKCGGLNADGSPKGKDSKDSAIKDAATKLEKIMHKIDITKHQLAFLQNVANKQKKEEVKTAENYGVNAAFGDVNNQG